MATEDRAAAALDPEADPGRLGAPAPASEWSPAPALVPGEVRFHAIGAPAQVGPARFADGDRVEWRARFVEPAAAARIAIVTSRRTGRGWERAVSGHELWLPHPSVVEYSGWIGPGAYDGPGSYVLRFIRDAVVLAEGVFEVLQGGPGVERAH